MGRIDDIRTDNFLILRNTSRHLTFIFEFKEKKPWVYWNLLMLKQFKSVSDQKKPTAMIQRNPKNQDFSLRKLKYFVIQFRKTERRIWWRDVIKMHYGKCSISECQLQCIKTPAPTASARIFLYASQHVFLSFLTHCTFFFTSNFLSHTATDVFWWNKRSASQLYAYWGQPRETDR